jgi:hypothetical protein
MSKTEAGAAVTRPCGISRRTFLKSAAAVGTVLPTIVPSSVFGSHAPSNRLNIAMIGLGSQGRRDLYALMSLNANIVALCDVDQRQTARIKEEAGLRHAKTYTDYRQLLKHEKWLDAVVIATPDHWHALLCRAAIRAGKHVYCEKPLARTVGEARALRVLARRSKSVTQMGNQGSASVAFRRGIEVIEAGALGQIRDIHVYVPGGHFPRGIDHPRGGGGAPHALNWDFWVGPARAQPYHEHLYHPFEWRGWYSFGSGQLGDFGCHAFNLPVRALKLGYPDHIEVAGTGLGMESYFVSGQVQYHFPARAELDEVTLNWYEEMDPPADVFRDVIALYGELPSGVLLCGDGGTMFTSPHNMNGIVKLRGDTDFHSILHHDALRNIPVRLPRVHSHYGEWLSACRGVGRTFSDFGTGGHLTEIVQAGVLAVRLGASIDWNGASMKVPGVPEADPIIHPVYRTRWMS